MMIFYNCDFKFNTFNSGRKMIFFKKYKNKKIFIFSAFEDCKNFTVHIFIFYFFTNFKNFSS